MSNKTNDSPGGFNLVVALVSFLLILGIAREVWCNAAALLQASKASSPFIAAGIAFLAAFVFAKRKAEFRTRFGLASLMKRQSEHWRTLAPAAKFDPDANDERTAPALTIGEFAAKHAIDAADEPEGKAHCARVFGDQLGKQWSGVLNAPIHARCIAFIAAVHAVENGWLNNSGIAKGEGLMLRQHIAVVHALNDDPLVRDAALESALRPYMTNPELLRKIDKIAGNHHFVSTALMRLVAWARNERGVLASAEFLWLKPVDRSLWYALNNLGRRSFHVEGAGAVAHYKAERAVRSPLVAPCVEKAVDAIGEWMKEPDAERAASHKEKNPAV